jgi:hypothetical protein
MEFPLDLRFKILAIASQISVKDASGRILYYVRQKAFKLKEAVTVFADAEQTRVLYKIAADRIIDLSPRYRIEDPGGVEVGALKRQGMRSLWRAHYQIEEAGRPAFVIREENPWTKVLDAILGGIPILGIFAGYFCHPAYLVSRGEGAMPILRIVKRPSFLEGKFQIEAPSGGTDLPTVVMPAVLMMLLLERMRG